MEELMNDASNRIKFESNSLGKLLENGHKVLISKIYLHELLL